MHSANYTSENICRAMSLGGFANLEGAPPGDQLQENEKTPFVWADQRN